MPVGPFPSGMWPMGHLAVAYLLYAGYCRARGRERPGEVPTLVVLFGSLFPDLVDKPLAWYLGVLPTGRTLAHSLLVLVPLTLGLYALARRRGHPEYGVAFAIGTLSHAFVDAAPVLWDPNADAGFLLWPLVPVPAYEDGAPTVTALFAASLGDPYFLAEFVLLALALVLWRRQGHPGVGPLLALTDRGSGRGS